MWFSAKPSLVQLLMATTLAGLASLAAVVGVAGQVRTNIVARETTTGLSLAAGGFSNDNGDRSENVSVKTSSHFFRFCRKYFSLFKTSNVGKFSWN